MQEVIERFYTAFTNLDADGMSDCYHPDIVFEDPAFGVLKGDRAKNMWRMLCASQKGKDFRVDYSQVKENGTNGSAHWEAFYTFSQTGRKVHNIVNATFVIKDGLIIKHSDDFDLHIWAKQAMGFKGWLLGGTSFFRNKLQTSTNTLLDNFEQKL